MKTINIKTAKIEVRRNEGHPWDGRKGFDVMFIEAGTHADMDEIVSCAKKKFWQPWLIGVNDNTGLPGGLMYKPCGAVAHWVDNP